MAKLGVVLLCVAVCVILSPANGLGGRKKRGGFLSRIKKPFQKQPQPEVVEKYVVIEQPPPCSTGQCAPDYVEERPCKSRRCKKKQDDGCQTDRCKTCRVECNGNEVCHNQCVIVDKCQNNCNGNTICMDQCGGQIQTPVFDHCSSCPNRCQMDSPLITHCPSNTWLYYVQIPKNITVNDIVSNPDLLQVYQTSNLELDSNGVSGRACLSDKTRFELTKLNASILPITNVRK